MRELRNRKPKLSGFKREIDKSTAHIGDINRHSDIHACFFVTNWTISKKPIHDKDIINHLNLTDISRTAHPTTAECIPFKCHH